MTVRPISDVIHTRGGGAGKGAHGSYIMPAKICATCQRSTEKAKHVDCKRDPRGRLLVLDEAEEA